jgi:hypothetical protein
MPELAKRPRYQVLDKVQVKHGSRLIGTVMEARGTYNPDGHCLYRVYVPMEPEPLLLLVTEEEIEKVET